MSVTSSLKRLLSSNVSLDSVLMRSDLMTSAASHLNCSSSDSRGASGAALLLGPGLYYLGGGCTRWTLEKCDTRKDKKHTKLAKIKSHKYNKTRVVTPLNMSLPFCQNTGVGY